MTVVIADKTRSGTVIMGSDTRVSAEGELISTPTPKVWEKNSMIIGATGDFSLISLLYAKWDPPKNTFKVSIEEYVHGDIRSSLERFFDAYHIGFVKSDKEDGTTPAYEIGLLVVVGGRIFTVDPHQNFLDIVEVNFPIAIGSGASYAKIGMELAQGSVETRMRQTISCVSKFDSSVDDNCTLVKVKYE